MSRAILITGGAGFLGSHLCESLLDDGHRVVCLDNVSSGRKLNIDPLRDDERFTFIQGDVRDPIAATIENHIDPELVDQLYHLASRASPPDFEIYPVEIATTNAKGTHNVLQFAHENNVRILYTSTSEVYGDPEEHPQSEEYTGNVNIRGPRACYDESKRYGEALITSYRTQYDLDVRTARIFNTYGPRMRSDDGRVISTFLTQALNGIDLTVHGDGSQTRSFLYVDDQIRGLRRLMENDELAGEVVNIGSTNEITIQTLAETILEIVDSESQISYEPRPTDDPQRRCPDITKAKRLLDWAPQISLQDGIAESVPSFS